MTSFNYQHILLAADFSEDFNNVSRKAQSLAQRFNAKLSLIHVLDNIPMPDMPYGTVIKPDVDYGNDLLEQEKQRFSDFCQQLDIAEENRWLVWGIPKQAITQLAKQQNVDLIVTGSHGRHGLALLFGSTTDDIVHHAPCDVLAVNLKNQAATT